MKTQLLLIAPLIAPLTAAGIAALGRGRRGLQRVASTVALVVVTGAGTLLTLRAVPSGVVHTVIGSETALTGIALTADPFGAALVAAIGLLTTVAVTTTAGTGDDHHPLQHPLLLVLVGGACGSFVAGDLFNLFVMFEVVLIASYVLLVLHGGLRQFRAAAVYVIVNLVGTVLLLAGIAAVFAATGTVNLALLAERPTVAAGAMPGAALVLIAFTLKAGLLPFSGWLVVGYPATRRTTMALFAGTMTTVGMAALYRVALLAFGDAEVLRTAVLVVAVATALLTSLAALAAADHGRVLALLITTQVGFMALGFGLGTVAGIAAGVFFVLQDVLVKTAVVLAYRSCGEHHPPVIRGIVTASFAVLALSLVGFPPLAGFVGKALLVEAALEAGAVVAAAVALAASAMTLAALLPLWWHITGNRDGGGEGTARRLRPGACAAPAAVVAVAAVAVGIVPGWLLAIAGAAAEVLADPAGYAQEVLGP
ncbi:proton-conducting transporter membrane subunit [Halopolyspora algeriensis]|nr:proton-conducting transporter membrane subunit [Halopolyspora algeriensis]